MTSASEVNDDFTDGLMSDFLDESTGLVSRLSENLSQLDQWTKSHAAEGDRPTDLLNEMFRSAHSIKGLSGMLRLSDINVLTHKVENVFDAARNGELPVTGESVDVIFQAIDCLAAMIDALKDPAAEKVATEASLGRIENLLNRYNSAREMGCQADVDPGLFEAARHAAAAEKAPVVAAARDVAASPKAEVVVDDPLADVRDDADIPPRYLAIFVDEAGLTLEDLSESLISVCEAEHVEAILCGCHRIKGSAASIGLQRAARVAHHMEDLLQDMRRRKAAPTSREIDVLLKGVDALRSYVAGLAVGGPDTGLLSEACRLLMALPDAEVAKPVAAAKQEAKATVATAVVDDWRAAPRAAVPEDCACLIGLVTFDKQLPLVELKIRVLLERLQSHGKLLYSAPNEAQLDEAAEVHRLVFTLATDVKAPALQGILRIEGAVAIEVEAVGEVAAASAPAAARVVESPATNKSTPAAATQQATPTEPAAAAVGDSSKAAPDAKAKPTETLRVDIERLDQLMNLSGQLVINRARFTQIGDRLKGVTSLRTMVHSLSAAQHCATRLTTGLQECAGGGRSAIEALLGLSEKLHDDLESLQRDLAQLHQVRSLVGDLNEAVHQLERVSDGIQNTVMDTRMVPIGPLFARFKRAVRDLTRDNHKDIDLEILGENTELDKRMIDELGDPLIHLVRNSADHGIEHPDVREAQGKPRQGTITLNAYHRGNRIVIEVTDDGKGLDADKIRAKAISRGLITEADAEKMTPQQFHELIWKPGFSTAETITQVSGRGMGMDIVWSKIEQLSGTVELSSEAGKGTTFLIKLPLTMAILPSLLAVIDRDVFAIPVESVVEIVRIGKQDVSTVHGRPAMRVRGRVISLIRLSDIFGESSVGAPSNDTDSMTVVIIGIGNAELGIEVDNLLGEQDVVIQSLAENFENIQGIAGASILGDGRVSLILDVGTLLEMACRPSRGAALEVAAD
ncbi:MAG: hypothetical protein C0483_07290 [Pirellula sp.]|nr:hypothetical protein [Pirellula sp.]